MTMQRKIKQTEGWPRKLLEKLVVLCLYKNEVGKGRERPHEFFFRNFNHVQKVFTE